MSIVRWGLDSEVYVYEGSDAIHCCACALLDNGDRLMQEWAELYHHLLAHKDAGHAVPNRVIGQVHALIGHPIDWHDE